MKRNIVHIHEDRCNGCGLCIDACHEGAIELVDGKARLVSDIYCDGLGACLPNCPTGAIEVVEREAEEFDEQAVEKRLAEKKTEKTHTSPGGSHAHGMGGCPGSMARRIERAPSRDQREASAAKQVAKPAADSSACSDSSSELAQWPVQITLVNPSAPFLQDAHLLVAADCTAYAYAGFHRDFIRGRIVVIGCPKLDDNAYYAEKLAEILKKNRIESITVVRMAVPCCGGIVSAVKQAMLNSGTIVPYQEITVGIEGQLL